MIYMKLFNRTFFFIILLSLVTIFTYKDLSKTFFQQDEWLYMGTNTISLNSPTLFLDIVLPFQGGLTHFFPFTTFYILLQYILFNTNFHYYALADIVFHLANGILVFLLIKKITKSEIFSVLTSLLFLTYSISHQAVSWVSAGSGILFATFFSLVTLLFFIEYLGSKKMRHLFISLASVLVALLFKEIAIFIFLFIPLYWLYFKKKTGGKFLPRWKEVLPFFILFGGYISLRLFFVLFNFSTPLFAVPDSYPAPKIVYLYRTIAVPLKGFSQSFFSQQFLIETSEDIARLSYPQYSQFVYSTGEVNPYISQTIMYDFLSYILSILLFVVAYIVFKIFTKEKAKTLKDAVVFSVLLLLTSLTPFILLPGKVGYFSIFEPRYLYIASIGASLGIVLFLFAISGIILRSKAQRVFFVCILVFLLVCFQIQTVHKDISFLKDIGEARKSFLTKVKMDYKTLPSQVMFYTESDQVYYGIGDQKILPVQSGFGQMLMVWYQDTEHFPICLYDREFLYEITSEGYRFCDGRGFGYFRNYNNLLHEFKKNNLKTESVIGYSWNSKQEKFSDITSSLRARIKKDLSNSL